MFLMPLSIISIFYEPGHWFPWHRLLRRTLLLKNSYELLAASHELMYFAGSSWLTARSLSLIVPNVQECDARNGEN